MCGAFAFVVCTCVLGGGVSTLVHDDDLQENSAFFDLSCEVRKQEKIEERRRRVKKFAFACDVCLVPGTSSTCSSNYRSFCHHSITVLQSKSNNSLADHHFIVI